MCKHGARLFVILSVPKDLLSQSPEPSENA